MTHHHYEAFVFLEARAVEEPPTCRHAHTHTLFSMEKTDLSEHFVTKQREKSTCNCFFWSWHCKEKKTSNKYINTMFLTSFEFESSLTKRYDHFFFFCHGQDWLHDYTYFPLLFFCDLTKKGCKFCTESYLVLTWMIKPAKFFLSSTNPIKRPERNNESIRLRSTSCVAWNTSMSYISLPNTHTVVYFE